MIKLAFRKHYLFLLSVSANNRLTIIVHITDFKDIPHAPKVNCIRLGTANGKGQRQSPIAHVLHNQFSGSMKSKFLNTSVAYPSRRYYFPVPYTMWFPFLYNSKDIPSTDRNKWSYFRKHVTQSLMHLF